MSFSKDVKVELSKLKDQERLPRPVLAGLFVYSRLFLEGDLGIRSESEAVVSLCARLIKRAFDETWIIISENDRLFRCVPENKITKITPADLYFLPGEEALFIRGAFLSCGTLGDPMRAYELAFSLSEGMDEQVLLKITKENNFLFRSSEIGKEGKRLYLKDSTSIEEFLTWIGAQKSVLSLMETKIYKEIRNQANRINNFDTSNIEKAASAGAEQSVLIEKLKKSGRWDSLPEEVKNVGMLRLEHPEVTLKELGDLCNPPLSRSSVFRRMEKIRKLASEE